MTIFARDSFKTADGITPAGCLLLTYYYFENFISINLFFRYDEYFKSLPVRQLIKNKIVVAIKPAQKITFQ